MGKSNKVGVGNIGEFFKKPETEREEILEDLAKKTEPKAESERIARVIERVTETKEPIETIEHLKEFSIAMNYLSKDTTDEDCYEFWRDKIVLEPSFSASFYWAETMPQILDLFPYNKYARLCCNEKDWKAVFEDEDDYKLPVIRKTIFREVFYK